MKLQQLRYFIAVYEEGSFTAGAARENATQSGLSMQIKELEERHGTVLLKRNSRGVTPTDAGHRFYKSAVKVQSSVAAAELELSRIEGSIIGPVRIGLMPTFTRSVLAPTLTKFTEKYPLAQPSIIETYSAQLCQMVQNRTLDFAIVPHLESNSGQRTRPVGTDMEFLVCAPNGVAEHLSPVKLRDMAPLKLVLPGPSNARRSHIDTYLAAQGIEVEAILELDAMFGTLDLVATSDWLTILPGILCEPDAGGETRSLHPIISPSLTVDYILIEPKTNVLSDAAVIFADMLQDELDKRINWHKELTI